MAHHTISCTSPYVFVHGSAGAGAQWAPIAALLRIGYESGPFFGRGEFCASVAASSLTGMVAEDNAPALDRGAIAAMMI